MSYLLESPAKPEVQVLGGKLLVESPPAPVSITTEKDVILLKLFEAPIAVLF